MSALSTENDGHTTDVDGLSLASTATISAPLAPLPATVTPSSRTSASRPATMLQSVRRIPTVRPLLIAGDLAAALATPFFDVTISWQVGLAAMLAVVVVGNGLGSYRSRLTLSVLDDVPALAAAALAGVAAISLFDADAGLPLVVLALLLFVLLTISRSLAYLGVRTARRRGLVVHNALVIGSGVVGAQVAQTALDHPEYGLRPVGFIDDEPMPADRRPVPLLGTTDRLAALVREHDVSDIVVALSRNDAELVDVVRQVDRLGVEVFCVPRLFELQHRSHSMDELWGIPLVRLRRATWRSGAWQVKRALDILVAGTALLILGPIMLAAALAVRLELGKGVIFHQVRIGLDGKPFTIYKFRSLRLPQGPGGSTPVWSINGDARLGPVGRFLRSTSIDELPQLFNILRGEMSLVGPRPERPVFVEQFASEVPRYDGRHRIPAGLTGWAQVNGLRGDTSIAERARFDNYYIQNWSLWLDLKIIGRTVSTVLFRRGS